MSVIKRDGITPDLQRKARELAALPQGAFRVFREATPRRTGNARSRTRLVRDEIQAQYPYALPLDRGSSRQAPRGMTEPTLAWLREQLVRIFN
jgi:hypothetical protein